MLTHLHFISSATLAWTAAALTSGYILRNKRPIHILYCAVDHYEPATGNVTATIARERLQFLQSEYPKLANRHRDAYGRYPKRTWFFPPHQHHHFLLRDLVKVCEKGYGEIELHLHHGNTARDTEENLRSTLLYAVKDYSSFGIFGDENGEKRYAFIHGNWALANSRRGKFCGVDNELEVLRDTGCYADFTFPSSPHESTPSLKNAIFYADPRSVKRKPHDTGVRVKVAGERKNEVMIIQGPAYPFFRNYLPWSLRVYGDGTTHARGTPEEAGKRVDAWVRAGVGVRGKPEWIIIKTHMHGATESEAVLGRQMDGILDYFESRYNDGKHYILHYVTAREVFNIIKAAEAGEPLSDPDNYRDYMIYPPSYDPGPDIQEASKELMHHLTRTVLINRR